MHDVVLKYVLINLVLAVDVDKSVVKCLPARFSHHYFSTGVANAKFLVSHC